MGPIMFQPWDMSKYFSLVHLFYQLLLAHMAHSPKKKTRVFHRFLPKKTCFFQKKKTGQKATKQKKQVP